jgi:carbamoyl-phosphate synthase large subunit
MRNASFKILREIGVDTGGSNVQFAINPKNGRMIVIEMNPRVSRSSALASKATGYPIAKVATLLAVGYTLDEITNDITNTPASFEPVIDYIVTKIPKFTFEKFPQANSTLTTSMKSVGEVMAIGTSFCESLQKALCSMESGLSGLDEVKGELDFIKSEIVRPNEKRLLYIAQAIRLNVGIDDIYNMCKIDKWFLNQIKDLVDFEKNITFDILTNEKELRIIKSKGFSDIKIAYLINKNSDKKLFQEDIYIARNNLNVLLEYNEVDTCAAEFKALTPYLYSTTNITPIPSKKQETTKENKSKQIMIIGSGPNRIGQGIEFDYCCVHASFALKEMGVNTIMHNCNPETVSTDYDTSDILYFEPIDFERLRSVIDREKPDGIIVHFGGQTPLKFAKQLEAIGVKIIGTSAESIDLAEDREKFSNFIANHNLLQPQNGIAHDKQTAIKIANEISYPVLVRPSYVLGGRAMRIVYSDDELNCYIQEAITISNKSPILIDKFLDSAIEIDVDAICDGKDLYLAGIMQHIEEAGIHSGDSACSLPPISIDEDTTNKIEQQTKKIALNLNVIGLLNIQFAIYKKEIYIIEVNPRASRTIPFVSKATGIACAKVATRVMYGKSLRDSLSVYDKHEIIYEKNGILKPTLKSHIAVKEAVFPFNKLDNSDFILGPEMKSTGEAMGISESFGVSFAKSQFSCNNTIPTKGTIFLSLNDFDKKYAIHLAKDLIEEGFVICATSGTYNILLQGNIESNRVLKLSEGRPNIIDSLKNKEIDLVINTSGSHISKNDSLAIRRVVLQNNIPYFSTIAAAQAAIEAIKSIKNSRIYPKSIQEYLAD